MRTPITYNTILTVGQRTNANETYAFGQVIDAIGQPVYEVPLLLVLWHSLP